MIYQFVYRKPNLKLPSPGEWQLLRRTASQFLFTGWRTNNFLDNLKTFLVRALRKHVVDPVVKPLRDQAAKLKVGFELIPDSYIMQKEELAEMLKNRNEELKWLHVATQVILTLIKSGELVVYNKKDAGPVPDELPEKMLALFGRLVQISPSKIGGNNRSGGFNILFKFAKGKAAGKGHCGISRTIVMTCLNIITKRSACFGQHKQKILDALHPESLV